MACRLGFLILAVAPVLGACADDETTPEPTCRDYADVTPGGSLANDVMPLFSRSCALATSCHQGAAGEGEEGLGLGPSLMMGPADPMTLDGIHDQLLESTATRSPRPLIVPSDPAGSWLMNKIEYDNATLSTCSECNGDCGAFMPFGSSPDSGLTRAERDTIAAWIKDGAPNN